MFYFFDISARVMLLRLESAAMLSLRSTIKFSIGQETNLSLGHACLHSWIMLKWWGEGGWGMHIVPQFLSTMLFPLCPVSLLTVFAYKCLVSLCIPSCMFYFVYEVCMVLPMQQVCSTKAWEWVCFTCFVPKCPLCLSVPLCLFHCVR